MKRLLLWAALAMSLAANATVALMALRSRSSAQLPLLAEVRLESDQRTKILALREDFHAFRKSSSAQTSELRGRLADLLKSETPERAAIDDLLGRINESQAALQARVVEHVLAVRGALRPDQRPAFEKQMTKNLQRGIPFRGECDMSEPMQGAQP